MTAERQLGEPVLSAFARALENATIARPDAAYDLAPVKMLNMQHLNANGSIKGLVNVAFYQKVYRSEYELQRLELGERAVNFLMVESEALVWGRRDEK